MTVVEATEIVPVSRPGLVELAAPITDIVAAQQAHHDICAKLLDADDYQSIGSKSFRKKSGWRKLAMAYSVSHEVLKEDYWYDAEGHICRAKFVVRATAPNGRYEDGIGLCDVSERNFGLKQDHDIPATAHTRAINRASSDLFGLGEVSAEEVDGGGQAPTYQSTQTAVRKGQNTNDAVASGPTDAQKRFMDKLIADQGLSSEDIIHDTEQVSGRAIGDVSELSVAEASKLIDLWKGDKS